MREFICVLMILLIPLQTATVRKPIEDAVLAEAVKLYEMDCFSEADIISEIGISPRQEFLYRLLCGLRNSMQSNLVLDDIWLDVQVERQYIIIFLSENRTAGEKISKLMNAYYDTLDSRYEEALGGKTAEEIRAELREKYCSDELYAYALIIAAKHSECPEEDCVLMAKEAYDATKCQWTKAYAIDAVLRATFGRGFRTRRNGAYYGQLNYPEDDTDEKIVIWKWVESESRVGLNETTEPLLKIALTRNLLMAIAFQAQHEILAGNVEEGWRLIHEMETFELSIFAKESEVIKLYIVYLKLLAYDAAGDTQKARECAMEYQEIQISLWAAEAADNDIVEPPFGLMDYADMFAQRYIE